MSDFIEYKGYQGSVEYSAEDDILYGEVQFIQSLLMYEGETLHELKEMFHQVIDDYLQFCKENGISPNQPNHE